MVESRSLAAFFPQPLVGLSREVVEDLSPHKGEPSWLRQRRLEAWRVFDAMPMPSAQDEDWRRTDVSSLRREFFTFYDDPGYHAERPEELVQPLRSYLPKDRAGLVAQHNSVVVYQALQEDLARRGVVFTSLDAAARSHADLLQEYLVGRGVPLSHSKFVALNSALWSGGIFLYVPPGVEVTVPLYGRFWISKARLAATPRALVVLGQDSSLTYVDEYSSEPARTGIMNSGLVEVFAGDRSRVQYITLQRWGGGVRNLMTQRIVLGQQAQVKTMLVALGSGLTKAYVETLLEGAGSQAKLYGLLLGDGSQHFDHQTLQDHVGPNTTSELLFRTALKDKARSVFTGLVVVHKDARRTDSYVANRNLLLSDKAKADSIPKLEIETSDVIRCGHGATVGQVDEAQIFYLMSRGLSRQEAERTIVDGFFEGMLANLPLANLRQRVYNYIRQKLNRGG